MENPLSTQPKNFIFVLMPFGEKFTDIYQFGIKSVCQALGAYCERVDEQIFHESILERIYNQIAKADLIIADMTDRNPNVFYEVGYAHALGKKVILLTQKEDDIPFDLKHYSHIVYEGKIAQLKNDLERRVQWYLQQPETSLFDPLTQLQFYISGNKITDMTEIQIKSEDSQVDASSISSKKSPLNYRIITFMDLSLHNTSNRVVNMSGSSISLIFPPEFDVDGVIGERIRLPDQRWLFNVECDKSILPQAWVQISRIRVELYSDMQDGVQHGKCILRLIFPSSFIEISFILLVAFGKV